LEQARSIDPFYAETHHFLGHLFYRLGRTREAKESLGRFLQLAPTTDTRRPLDLDLMRRIKPSPKSP
jgi:tetratricopeptide (TPR) repeat protein